MKCLISKFFVVIFCLSSSVANASESVGDPLALAQTSFEKQNYRACIRLAKLVSSNSERYVDARFISGRCFERLGEFEMAYREFSHIVQSDVKYADGYYNRAIQSLKNFKLNRARENISEWQRHVPNDPRISKVRIMLEQVIAEQKRYHYSDGQARELIKNAYLKSVELPRRRVSN